MNNRIFYFRVAYLIIIVALTLCYIFGDTFSWWDCAYGLVYGFVIADLLKAIKRLRHKRETFSRYDIINAVFFVFFTLCYVFGGVVHSYLNWISGLAYGWALKGLLSTFRKEL